MSNFSAFLDGENKPLRVAESHIPTPGPKDIIVRNHAVAINTVDPAQQAGFKVARYPTVLGHDLAGIVHEVGSSVIRFKKGDRILGHAWQFLTGQAGDGAFSLYTRIPAGNAAILPNNVYFKQGAVLPVAIDTAARGFYDTGFMGLDLPTTDAKPNGKVVVVYGGSTSVGAAAIQLAVNAGYRVIATSSPRNYDLCRAAGASDVFDYKSPSIVDDIAKSVGTDQFVGLWNTIGIPESFDVVTPIMQKLGGGFVANTKPPGPTPEGITVKFVLGLGEYSYPLWEHWITAALALGKLKALPEPKVVGKGLESLEHAFEVRNGDVSGCKIVVEL
ncbi:hypothetical protein B0A48_13349 [Cryoendolithus antarcticus]|uniref:Enoyl reductase (ER) domain-containing protein n=1 Tax=Cryoendolithus antarcticus TaxID=1507870 RepID=A0A1V8SPK7_9PEZI|nr:hypothetical protein B0A48_13349 [Cryoendolithus antarcticus]